jgi:hypothetical protein
MVYAWELEEDHPAAAAAAAAAVSEEDEEEEHGSNHGGGEHQNTHNDGDDDECDTMLEPGDVERYIVVREPAPDRWVTAAVGGGADRHRGGRARIDIVLQAWATA